MRPVQKCNPAQPGGAVPLLGLLQQLRPAGPEEVRTLVIVHCCPSDWMNFRREEAVFRLDLDVTERIRYS